MRRRIRTVAFAILTVCLLAIFLSPVFGVSSSDASATISDAENALQTAFVNVSDAEQVGVNVSGLLGRLNEASSVLSLAELAFNDGNYSSAVSQAATCKALAEDAAKEAVSLKNGDGGWDSNFLGTLFLGLVGAGVFVVVLGLTWLSFKRYYLRKLEKSRLR